MDIDEASSTGAHKNADRLIPLLCTRSLANASQKAGEKNGGKAACYKRHRNL